MEDNVKQALLDGTATIQTEIEILSKDNTDNVILTEENGIVSWDYEDFRYVKDEGWIGQFIAKQVNGTIKNISDDFSMTDKEFVLKMGVKIDDETIWYSLGNFLVNKITDDEVGDKTTFEALDYTKKFNQKYVDTITYPCTALELAQNVCQQCGCELGHTDFKHNDWEITGNAFTNGESCRDVLKAIGKLAYSWVRVDWDNKVYLDFTVNKTTEEYNKITNHEYYTLKTQKEKIGAINRVVIGYKDIEGERTKVENAEDIEVNGVHEITIFDNPLVYNQELRKKAIIGAEELLGLEYMPMEMLTVGHPWLRGDELLEVTDMEGKVHKTIPFDRTIQYFGHIKTNINVATNTKTNTEYSYEGGVGGRLRKTEISVDKINGQITEIIKEQDETTEKLNETISTVDETKQTISKVETTVTDITTTTQTSTGGNTLHIEEALESNTLDYVIEGMSYQETTTGKNKLDFDTLVKNANFIIKNNDGSYSITGNATATSTERIDCILEAGTYSTSADYKSSSNLTYSEEGNLLAFNMLFEDGTDRWVSLIKTSDTVGIRRSIIFKIEKKVIGIQLQVFARFTSGTVTFKNAQIGTDDIYEPYTGGQPSPSPDYPEDVEVIEPYNLFDKDNENINYYVKPNTGELIENQVWNTSDFIEVSINTPYTLSGKQSEGSAFAITEYDANKQLIKRSTSSSSVTNYFSVTTTSTTKYARASYRNDKITDEIQVIEGTIPKPYVPYGHIQTKIISSNLYNIDDIKLKSHSTILDDDFTTISVDNSNGTNTIYANNMKNPSNVLKTNTTYYIVVEVKEVTGTGGISFVSNYNNNKGQFDNNIHYGFSNLKNGDILIHSIKTRNSFDDCTTMLRQIATFDSGRNGSITYRVSILDIEPTLEDFIYEPYQEKNVYINLQGNFIGKIGDIKDELRIENGRAILTKRIGKFIPNGNTNIFPVVTPVQNNSKFYGMLSDFKATNNNLTQIYSNIFTGKPANIVWLNDIIYSCSVNAGSSLHFRVDTTLDNTTLVRNFLIDNNCYFIGVLTEPYEVDLGDINIPLFEGINNVSLIQDLETTTSIRYLRETPLSGDSLLKQQLDATNDGLSDINNQVNQNTSDINNTNVNLNNNYYNKNQIDVINSSTSQELTQIKNSVETKVTAEDLNIAIAEIKTTGVTSVTTETGYTFDKDGLKIQKSDSEMSSQLDNDGLVVKRDETEVLTVRSQGVETENLTVRTYFTIGDNTRVENYKGGTGFFYVGGAD